jgi:hypothetical protein
MMAGQRRDLISHNHIGLSGICSQSYEVLALSQIKYARRPVSNLRLMTNDAIAYPWQMGLLFSELVFRFIICRFKQTENEGIEYPEVPRVNFMVDGYFQFLLIVKPNGY